MIVRRAPGVSFWWGGRMTVSPERRPWRTRRWLSLVWFLEPSLMVRFSAVLSVVTTQTVVSFMSAACGT